MCGVFPLCNSRTNQNRPMQSTMHLKPNCSFPELMTQPLLGSAALEISHTGALLFKPKLYSIGSYLFLKLPSGMHSRLSTKCSQAILSRTYFWVGREQGEIILVPASEKQRRLLFHLTNSITFWAFKVLHLNWMSFKYWVKNLPQWFHHSNALKIMKF